MSEPVENQSRSPIPNASLQNDKGAFLLLWLCLSADFAYMVLHVIREATPFLESSFFSVKRDLGYSEFFQYVKFLWIILLLIYIFKKSGSWGFLAWGTVIVYFLVDDAFQVHEQVGAMIAGNLDFTAPFNLRLQDIGELAVYAVAGMALIPGVALAFWRGSKTFQGISKDILFLMAILVFLGVFVDMAEIAADLGDFVEDTLALIDDGGEMIVTSVLFWYIFQLAIRNGNMDNFLHHRLRIRARRKDRDQAELPAK